MNPTNDPPLHADQDASKRVVLILSTNAVPAALLAALLETMGFEARFCLAAEQPNDALRRTRPSLLLVDHDDGTMMTDEILGRARMRGVSIVMFGSNNGSHRMRELALAHQCDVLVLPTSLDSVADTLRSALSRGLDTADAHE